MSNRLLSISCLAALTALGFSCKQTTRIPNLDHCTYNGGDEFCAANYPEAPLCNAGEGMCAIEGDLIGCHAEVTAECHAPCGEPGDLSCVDGSSSGTGSGSGTEGSSGETAETEGSSSSDGGMTTTTGDMPCMGDEDCTDSAAPFCDPAGECVDCGALADGNAACAEADPGRPVCDAGVCVACTEQDPGACGGQTPVCGEDNLCQACSEHSECPGTACHLDGPQVGACFDAAEVVMANSTAQLQAAFAGVGAGDDVVILLTGMNYSGTAIDFTADAEVAIIGDGSETIAGNRPGGLIATGGPSIVYVAGTTIASNSTGDGLACSGTSLWLDDSEVRNNAQVGMDISGGCAVHLRRSVVRANAGGGIDAGGATIDLRNSAIAGNGGMFSTLGGVALADSDLRATYTTIAGNDAQLDTRISLYCTGIATGTVTNSILVGSGDSINGCAGLTFETNAVDIAGFPAGNDDVGPLDPGWFSNPGLGDFHLTTAAEPIFADIAMWQEGDPVTDIDGQPIPTAMPSFPGYDQP